MRSEKQIQERIAELRRLRNNHKINLSTLGYGELEALEWVLENAEAKNNE